VTNPEPTTTEPTTDTTASTEPAATDTTEPRPGSEAARHRVRAREAEQQRDQLAGRLAAVQRAEVSRLVSEHLADATDLVGPDYDVAALLAEDGTVDADKVDAVVDELLVRKPHLARERPELTTRRQPVVVGQHYDGDGNPVERTPRPGGLKSAFNPSGMPVKAPSWADLFGG
jgi:hypothetical protein